MMEREEYDDMKMEEQERKIEQQEAERKKLEDYQSKYNAAVEKLNKM